MLQFAATLNLIKYCIVPVATYLYSTAPTGTDTRTPPHLQDSLFLYLNVGIQFILLKVPGILPYVQQIFL